MNKEKKQTIEEKLEEEYIEYVERIIHGDSDEGVEGLRDFRCWKRVYYSIYE